MKNEIRIGWITQVCIFIIMCTDRIFQEIIQTLSQPFLNFFFCSKNKVCLIHVSVWFQDSLTNFTSFCFQSHTVSSLAMRLRVIMFISFHLPKHISFMFFQNKKAIISFLMKFFLNNHVWKILCKTDLLYPVYTFIQSGTLRFEKVSETLIIKVLSQRRVLKLFISLQYFRCILKPNRSFTRKRWIFKVDWNWMT